jgi:hypothetical protein
VTVGLLCLGLILTGNFLIDRTGPIHPTTRLEIVEIIVGCLFVTLVSGYLVAIACQRFGSLAYQGKLRNDKQAP